MSSLSDKILFGKEFGVLKVKDVTEFVDELKKEVMEIKGFIVNNDLAIPNKRVIKKIDELVGDLISQFKPYGNNHTQQTKSLTDGKNGILCSNSLKGDKTAETRKGCGKEFYGEYGEAVCGEIVEGWNEELNVIYDGVEYCKDCSQSQPNTSEELK